MGAFKLPVFNVVKAPHMDFGYIFDSFMAVHGPDSEEPRGQGYFHPSHGLHPEMGLCTRALVFDLLCAPRNHVNIDGRVRKIFDVGHDRHARLATRWAELAAKKWQGVVAFESEYRLVHPTLPIEGTADGRIHVQHSGKTYRYVVDFKGLKEEACKKLTETSFKYAVQLNTYMGMGGDAVGYVMHESKNTQRWVEPLINFRLDFDPKMYRETEQYCRDVLTWVQDPIDSLPPYEEDVCKDNYGPDQCEYSDICFKCQNNPDLLFEEDGKKVDRRTLPIIARQKL